MWVASSADLYFMTLFFTVVLRYEGILLAMSSGSQLLEISKLIGFIFVLMSSPIVELYFYRDWRNLLFKKLYGVGQVSFSPGHIKKGISSDVGF